MPLRVSDAYGGELGKKVHKKMSRNGHFEKVRRPTNLEVYNDAARILEELLEKRLDEHSARFPKARRNKTDPAPEQVEIPGHVPESPVARSKTMPSKFRESKDEELKKKELDALREIDKVRHENNDGGSVSSADTDGENSQASEKRRKKSLFKRAKERLIHTFHRDQKEGFDKVIEKQNQDTSPPKRRRQKKGGAGQVLSEERRRILTHIRGHKTVDYTEERDYRGEDGSAHTEIHSTRKDRGSIFSSFRKSKRKNLKDSRFSVSQDGRSSHTLAADDKERLRGGGEVPVHGDAATAIAPSPQPQPRGSSFSARGPASSSQRRETARLPQDTDAAIPKPPPVPQTSFNKDCKPLPPPPSSDRAAAPPPPPSSFKSGGPPLPPPPPSSARAAAPPPPPSSSFKSGGPPLPPPPLSSARAAAPPPPPSSDQRVTPPPPPPPPPREVPDEGRSIPSSRPIASRGKFAPQRPPHPSSSHSKSSSPSPDTLLQSLGALPRAGELVASASSSNVPMSEHASEEEEDSNSNLWSSMQSNVLDSPGDEIQFMDVDETVRDNTQDASSVPREGNSPSIVPASGIKFHDSQGLLNMSWLADRSAQSEQMMDLELDERTVTTQRADGSVQVTTTVSATRTVVLPHVPEEHAHDVVDGFPEDVQAVVESEPEDRDAMYGRIAQRLIEMADSYSQSMSDQESHGAVVEPTPLSELEKEIIECLRSSGDRSSKQFDEAVEFVKQDAQQDAYQRFRSTVQNSMGSELSWDHLAFVFYTAKGVVSAVGKGSKVATQTKEFTLQYISETFATWIMDQGGFDSMLSSSESDYDLD